MYSQKYFYGMGMQRWVLNPLLCRKKLLLNETVDTIYPSFSGNFLSVFSHRQTFLMTRFWQKERNLTLVAASPCKYRKVRDLDHSSISEC